MCVDGRELDLNSGQMHPCPTCGGRGALPPNDICNCGRPCFVEHNNILYCGNKDCLTEIEREIRVQGQFWGFYATEDDDADFNPNTWAIHPHRIGASRMGGARQDPRNWN